MSNKEVIFKFANEDWEFEQIHRLNYAAFVEEIPQHERNPEGKLIDKFHEENRYLIGICDNQVIAMVAFRDQRPFSLDFKMDNLDSYLPKNAKHKKIVEIRLLVIKQQYRFSRISHELLMQLMIHVCHHYDFVVVSATTRQQKLYEHMTFKPFGPILGAEGAQFQPMYAWVQEGLERIPQLRERFNQSRQETHKKSQILLQPGPVMVNPAVRVALVAPSISHRSDSFRRMMDDCKRALCHLVNADDLVFAMGSGTLANDIVAGQLAQLPGRGLILSNGEFGDRLADHARRLQLNFSVCKIEWGECFTHEKIAASLSAHNDWGWLWATHCETSTGIINDLDLLKSIARQYELQLALDCISSVGLIRVDLEEVFLASCVSGKGLCSYAGLAMIFHRELPAQHRPLPRYLDLDFYIKHKGIPFTSSSHLMRALKQALFSEDYMKRLGRLCELTEWLEAQLKILGVQIIAPSAVRNPAVLTFALPTDINSQLVGDALAQAGYLLSYQSGYLAERNWLQICLFGGHYDKTMFNHLFEIIQQHLEPQVVAC
ncbi:MAG: aminotransferase class V-fold PLP-dependent enzyme [Legionellales bacterium]|nr:aminotransferase class V-fold PLP-dependent enzyme [Legionellales bacterium]